MNANFAGWLRRRHDRNLLMRLDDRQLADIGINRSEIEQFLAGDRSRPR